MRFKYGFLVLFLAAGCAHTQSNTNVSNSEQRNETASNWVGGDRAPASNKGTSYNYLSVNGTRTTDLARCGGDAILVRDGEDYVLKVSGSHCSNLVTPLGEWKLKGKGNTNRYIDIRIDSDHPGYHKVLVGSNSYTDSDGAKGNGDMIYVYVPPRQITLNLRGDGESDPVTLPNCGGTIYAKIRSGTVNVIIHDVNTDRCDTFDILKNNGDKTDYPSKSVESSGSASFSIPKKFVDQGKNSMTVSVGKVWGREDRVNLVFDGAYHWR